MGITPDGPPAVPDCSSLCGDFNNEQYDNSLQQFDYSFEKCGEGQQVIGLGETLGGDDFFFGAEAEERFQPQQQILNKRMLANKKRAHKASESINSSVSSDKKEQMVKKA